MFGTSSLYPNMSRELVESVLTLVRTSTDKALILKGLIKLRTDVVKDPAGIVLFREAGGVPLMVKLLNKPHSKILEVALSILANCCTDDICCAQSFEARVATSVGVILKSLPTPLIQTRACRLLGNLAKYDHTLLVGTNFSNSAVAEPLFQILKETKDPQTRLMGIRACRFLLKNSAFARYFLYNDGLVHMLRILEILMRNEAHIDEKSAVELEKKESGGLKKNQHREKYFMEVVRNLEGVRSDIFDLEMLKNLPRISNQYVPPEAKDDQNSVCEITRCLVIISETNISQKIWLSLEVSSCTLAPIVSLASANNEHRSAALKILSNFSKFSLASHYLGVADAVVVACEMLPQAIDEKQPISESERRHCLNIISHMSVDACSRSKIRRTGAIKKLIAIARQSDSQTEISAILYALNNFQFDQLSMELMLNEGLIQVLIKELDLYLTSDDEYYTRKREEKKTNATKKRKLKEDITRTCFKMAKTQSEAYFDYDTPSTSSSPPMSPASHCESRSMSPMDDRTFNIKDEDSNYSPVCSDDEGDEGKDDDSTSMDHDPSKLFVNKESNMDVFKVLEIACKTETNDEIMLDPKDDDDASNGGASLKLPNFGNLSRNTIDIIENLFYRTTLLINKRAEFGKADTLKTLIKAINTFGASTNFAMSLSNILQESKFFVHIIKQSIAHQLYHLAKSEEMRTDGLGFLDTLTCVGESNYGKEELAYLLRCDDVFSQKRAAITVAYIIKSHRLLHQFLEEGQALRLLLDIMFDESRDETTAEAVDAFTSMCKSTLGITVNLPYKSVIFLGDFDSYREDDTKQLHENCDMKFQVFEREKAEPVTVKFNKELLCKSSEVFNTMLHSDFREGNEGEIHLRTCTASGLRYFLNLLVRQANQMNYNIPPEDKHHAVLEALEMSRVYIIPDLEKVLEHILMYLLDESNCLSVFEWSMENYHAELREMAINYFLCSSLPADVKVELFRNASNSKFASDWHQMIREAIVDRCLLWG